MKNTIFATGNVDVIRYQEGEELAMKKMMDREGCKAFSNRLREPCGME